MDVDPLTSAANYIIDRSFMKRLARRSVSGGTDGIMSLYFVMTITEIAKNSIASGNNILLWFVSCIWFNASSDIDLQC